MPEPVLKRITNHIIQLNIIALDCGASWCNDDSKGRIQWLNYMKKRSITFPILLIFKPTCNSLMSQTLWKLPKDDDISERQQLTYDCDIEIGKPYKNFKQGFRGCREPLNFSFYRQLPLGGHLICSQEASIDWIIDWIGEASNSN